MKTTFQSLVIVLLFSKDTVDGMLEWMESNGDWWAWTGGIVRHAYDQAMRKYDNGAKNQVCFLEQYPLIK